MQYLQCMLSDCNQAQLKQLTLVFYSVHRIISPFGLMLFMVHITIPYNGKEENR